MNNSKKVAIFFQRCRFLAGLGTSIALTLHLAPQSAANTRSLITTKVKDGEGWIRQKATENETAIVNSRS